MKELKSWAVSTCDPCPKLRLTSIADQKPFDNTIDNLRVRNSEGYVTRSMRYDKRTKKLVNESKRYGGKEGVYLTNSGDR